MATDFKCDFKGLAGFMSNLTAQIDAWQFVQCFVVRLDAVPGVT